MEGDAESGINLILEAQQQSKGLRKELRRRTRVKEDDEEEEEEEDEE